MGGRERRLLEQFHNLIRELPLFWRKRRRRCVPVQTSANVRVDARARVCELVSELVQLAHLLEQRLELRVVDRHDRTEGTSLNEPNAPAPLVFAQEHSAESASPSGGSSSARRIASRSAIVSPTTARLRVIRVFESLGSPWESDNAKAAREVECGLVGYRDAWRASSRRSYVRFVWKGLRCEPRRHSSARPGCSAPSPPPRGAEWVARLAVSTATASSPPAKLRHSSASRRRRFFGAGPHASSPAIGSARMCAGSASRKSRSGSVTVSTLQSLTLIGRSVWVLLLEACSRISTQKGWME